MARLAEAARRGLGALNPIVFVGAHAQVAGMALLTRNASRYRTYFPGAELIAPDG